MARNLLTLEEVATRIRKTPAATRWLRHSGELPAAAKIGGRLVWDEAVIDQYIEDAFAEAS